MKKRILVVDDNPKNLQVIAALLNENNYAVDIAMDGKHAIRWVKRCSFDAILLDVMMPEMNGFETCEIIKQDPSNKDVPVIFLTALNDIDSISEGFEKGGVDYLTKPFNHKELLMRLGTHVELKRSREKLVDLNGWLLEEVNKKTADLKESNDKLTKANTELKEFDLVKSDFLNSISHELRTPLNGIVGSMNLLRSFDHDDHVKEVLDLLESSVVNLEKYSYSALQISNLQIKGESQLNIKAVDINALIRSMLPSLKRKTERKDIELVFTTHCNQAVVNADIEYLQNAMAALVECSIIFTKEGEVNIDISDKDEGYVEISIIDKGSLYNGTDLKHFFKSITGKNYQFQRNNAMELYLAKMIILLHNGKIEFNNLENESGTKTSFFLPLQLAVLNEE
ncbi:hybrid sensor histidine kinase/response regulator [Labilibacter marinus]|uniref:hybrid sensor histidine kinase/response regulator n=1 Tax=Labilibacter marinus TaxID=1477105 RepID=UPI00094FDE13|nr:hybrid sensor histidine kinase/response regulator [Labilibacter marinus]